MKRFALIEEPGKVLRRAWSVRFHLLGSLCGLGEVILPWFSDVIPRGPLTGLMLTFNLLGLYARFVKQPRMRDDAR